MNKQRPDWSKEQLLILRDLRYFGLSFSKCANKLGITKSAVAGQVFRHQDHWNGYNKAPSLSAIRLAQFDPLIRRAISG